MSQIWLLEGKDDCILWVATHWYVGCCRKWKIYSIWCWAKWDPQKPMDGRVKTKISAQLQSSKCSVFYSIYGGIHQGPRLQKCKVNVGHADHNI